MTVKLLTGHNLEFLRLKGGCTGSSESTLVKIPHCWKSHAAAIIGHSDCILFYALIIHWSEKGKLQEKRHNSLLLFSVIFQLICRLILWKMNQSHGFLFRYKPIELRSSIEVIKTEIRLFNYIFVEV